MVKGEADRSAAVGRPAAHGSITYAESRQPLPSGHRKGANFGAEQAKPENRLSIPGRTATSTGRGAPRAKIVKLGLEVNVL